MNGTLQDESNGYKCHIFNDFNSDGIVRKCSFDSMSERWNEEGNGEEEQVSHQSGFPQSVNTRALKVCFGIIKLS
jgi:hypothetical protein